MAINEMVMERPTAESGKSAPDTTIKTVLLHVQNDESLVDVLETGLSLARACSAHLSCIHVTPVEAYVAFDGFGGVFVMKGAMEALDKEVEKLESRVREELDHEDVSWDYQQVTASIAQTIAGRGALSDLVITSRAGTPAGRGYPAISMIGDILDWARTPVLIPAEKQSSFTPDGVALIAWDGSFQAANAVRSSIGLLKLASEVRVIQIDEKDKDDQPFPGTRLLEYLSRHGIHAELHVEPKSGRADHEMVTAMLLAHAKAARASYMVLGAYSHSRIGEYVFGGVTRSLLTSAPVSLVLGR